MRLYRFRYSSYCFKVQAALQLAGVPVTTVDVPYLDRSMLLALAPGYVHVPVLEVEPGRVLTDSRAILSALVADGTLGTLVPRGLEAAAWAYHDWCDSQLEDPHFRWCTPLVRDRWSNATEKALFTLVKERKFGTGCVERWAAETIALKTMVRRLLEPTVQSLSAHPFVLGSEPTIADVALYGQLAMGEHVEPGSTITFGAALGPWLERLKERGVRGD